MNIKEFFNKIVKKIKSIFTVEPAPVKKDNKTVAYEDDGQLSIFDDVTNDGLVEEVVEDVVIVEEVSQAPVVEDDVVIIENVSEDVERYVAETITRPVLIEVLREHGVKGSLTKMKKAELLEKFYELNIDFPEKKD